jgi:hypothetical protein
MSITISFQRRDSAVGEKQILAPEEFFDPLDAGETFEKDGVPRFNHDWYYLNLSPIDLAWSKLEVEVGTRLRTVYTEYFADGDAIVVFVREPSGWQEIIASTKINERQMHILRVHRSEDAWRTNTNVVVTTHPDGTQSESKFHLPKKGKDAQPVGMRRRKEEVE